MYFSYKLSVLQTPNINRAHLEEQQWEALKKGDINSFSEIYKFYSAQLYNYGTKFSKDKDLIKDCIQELFVQIWSNRTSLTKPAHIKNYLFKSFRNLIFKKKSQLKISNELDDLENYEFNLNIEEIMIADENHKKLLEMLQTTISKLTSRQQEAIYLKFFEHLSYDDIAEEMGITVKAAYKIVARSLNVLRNNLSKKDLISIFCVLILFN